MGEAFHRHAKRKGSALLPAYGAAHRSARLTEEQVYEIRARYDAGERGKAAAKDYGIHEVHFNCIGRRARWRSLPEKTFPNL